MKLIFATIGFLLYFLVMGTVGAVSKRAGKASQVQFQNTTNQSVIDWEVAEQGENIDTTALDDYNPSSGVLNKTSRTGPQYATWKLNMIWNASQNFYDDPPGFFPRDLVGPLKIIINVADNTFWDFLIVDDRDSCRLEAVGNEGGRDVRRGWRKLRTV